MDLLVINHGSLPFSLHGYSAIPIMLGLGCKVPAHTATRMLTARRDKILTTALILMCAPCLPQSAMILSLGMPYGAPTVIAVFAILLVFSLFVNAILNRIMKGGVAEMFVDMPHYRRPRVRMGPLLPHMWFHSFDRRITLPEDTSSVHA
jgi:ferrous iron transport protein B